MARNAGVSTENNFTKGLITEVTGVNSPENSVTDSINVIFDRRGRAQTRKGFALEEGSVGRGINTEGVRNEFLWETVSDNNSKDFVVLQFGSNIRFFEVTGSDSLSSQLMPFSVNLLTYKNPLFSNEQVRSALCTFASGKGYLFITHPNCETLYVAYDEGTNTITTKTITIQIRDFEGVEDGLNFDLRPNTLSKSHKYNLYNQGWYASVQREDTDNIESVQALDYWDSKRSDFPANSDVWWYYTTTGITGSSGGPASSLDKFDPAIADVRKDLYGNSPAPKGHYIINALQSNRSTLSGISGVKEVTSNGFRPSVVAFFTGRAFYGGVGKSGFSSTVYFTQIIEEDEQLSRCYQLNDPTSREAADLLSSDGGTIKIHDIAAILDMRVIDDKLYVFASNGVWVIMGSDNGPFKATDYVVSKISSYPAISKTSIVDVGGLPVWWNYEGIFTLKKTEVGLSTEVMNLTQETIQKFYDAIPQDSKITAKGSYNDQIGIVCWLYNVMPEDGQFKYTNVLMFDVISLAFYPMSLPDGEREVSGVLALRGAGASFRDENVVDNLNADVLDNSNANVTVSVFEGFSARSKIFKFVTILETGNVTFSEVRDTSYLDWGDTPYPHYFVTGYRIRGDLLKLFQTNYLTVITEQIDNGSAYVQAVWDYVYDGADGQYSNPQQVYRYRVYRSYQRSRLKMRGRGYSLQFKFFGEAGKPFIIVGWSGFETSDAMP